MAIDKLISKAVTFNSPKTYNSRLINSKYYTTSPLNPKIETNKIINSNGKNIEFSIRKFDNGKKFELYKLPDEVIKVIKNKFGEIKAFKSSIDQHNENPYKTYENAKASMNAQIKSFLS